MQPPHHHRRPLAVVLSLVISGGVLWLAAEGDGPRPAAAPRPEPTWVKLVFGTDNVSARWDGRLEVQGGRLSRLVDWGFEARDSLQPVKATWKATTARPAGRRVTFAEPQRGLLARIEGGPATRLVVTTSQGKIDLRLKDLPAGRPREVLEGRATLERLGSSREVNRSRTDDDWPAVAVDAAGHRHLAWIAFDADRTGTRLLYRDLDTPGSTPQLIVDGEIGWPQLWFDPDGTLVAAWCAADVDGDWNIEMATRSGRTWRPGRVSTRHGNDLHLDMAQGADGSTWLTWQSFRDGQAEIYAARRQAGRWSRSLRVSRHEANDWQPAISVDDKGTAWVAWDSYRHGNYDVFLRRIDWQQGDFRLGDLLPVICGAGFEAHASVLAECDGRVWVACDAAGPGWGKDFRNGPTRNAKGRAAEPLHASRRIELRCVVDGRVFEPVRGLPQRVPAEPVPVIDRSRPVALTRFYEQPRLARDGEGRIWLLFRLCRQGYSAHPPRGLHWKICATTLTARGWLEPIELPQSRGRQHQRVTTAVAADGRLCCAWSTGDRFASVNRKYEIRSGVLPAIGEPAAKARLRPVEVELIKTADPAPPASWSIRHEGRTLVACFGDLHRHTNISRCAPTIDGCLDDAHRYALDAAQLDFLGVTDHSRDVEPYAWWRTNQANDFYHLPGHYVTIYSYERSNRAASGGHRNVFLERRRGAVVNRSEHYFLGRNLDVPNTDPDKTLYPALKKTRGALTAAHTPEYSAKAMRGTWTYHDPQVEPIAEIYQAFRRSYERPGMGVVQQQSLWYALAQGHRLGFIASSDHLATHTSYACVWAKEKTRRAIFEALRARRTWGATDRITLETRIGETLMGGETRVEGPAVTLTLKVQGTSAIREIEVVRSGEVIGRIAAKGAEFLETRFVDRQPKNGRSYYYIRLLQEDGELAWASPIWVTRGPGR